MNLNWKEIDSFSRQLSRVMRDMKIIPDLIILPRPIVHSVPGLLLAHRFPGSTPYFAGGGTIPRIAGLITYYETYPTKTSFQYVTELKNSNPQGLVKWVLLYTSQDSPGADAWLMLLPPGDTLYMPWES